MPTIIAFTSGSKGGTGKSTLSVATSVILSSKFKTLLVDCGGKCTRFLLELFGVKSIDEVPPPYLHDLVKNIEKSPYYIYSYEVPVDKFKVSLSIIPEIRTLTDREAEEAARLILYLKRVLKTLDFIILDFPATNIFRYDTLLKVADTLVIVLQESFIRDIALEVFGIMERIGSKSYIGVINKAVGLEDTAEEFFGNQVVKVPFDENLRLLPVSLNFLNSINKETAKALSQIAFLLYKSRKNKSL